MMVVVAHVAAACWENLALLGFASLRVLPCARLKSAGQMVVGVFAENADRGRFAMQVTV